MPRIAPDARQLSALHAQLGLLEQMLKPVVAGTHPPPSNVVQMPQRGPTPQQQAMQTQMLEQMLAGMDGQRATQIRALMTVAAKPNVSPQEMEAAVAPLLVQLSAQDQGTVRMMLSMMQQQGHSAGAAGQPSSALPATQPPGVTMTAEMQNALETVTARAATALEEARRVAAELVSLKDTQNQTAAAMFQQTQVMRDMLEMLRANAPEATQESADEPSSAPQDAPV